MNKDQRLKLIKKVARKVQLQRKNEAIQDFAYNKRFRQKTTMIVEGVEIDDSDNINSWTDSEQFAENLLSDVRDNTVGVEYGDI